MSHTNSTTHYGLPQFITSDKPAWLTDVNAAMSAIDTGIYNAKDAADNAQSDATQALTDSGTALSTANSANSKATGAIASLANDFSAASTYAVGDYVMYNSLLYVCSVAVTTPGAWTGVTNWSRALVSDLDALIPRSSADLSYSGGSKTTKQAIDDLSTVTEGSISVLPGNSITIMRYTITKVGNVKFLSIMFKRTGTATTLGSLSAGFEAIKNYDFAGAADTGEGFRMRIEAGSSVITFASAPPQDQYAAFTIAYY